MKTATIGSWVACAALLLGPSSSVAEPTSPEKGEGVSSPAGGDRGPAVATVNGVAIFSDDLEDRVEAERKLRYLGADLTESELVFLRRRALEQLIGQELLFQAARRKRMKVSRQALSERVEAASAPFASEETFKDHLERAGLSVEQLMDQAERRLIIDAYSRGITGEVEIDPSEVREAYEKEKQQFTTRDEVRVQHIVILVAAEAPAEEREAARRKLEEVRKRAEHGEDFATLAREYSESPFAEKGGDLGFVPRGRMRPEFDSVVFRTPVGAITPVFETAYGFNLVKVLARHDASVRPFEEVRAGLTMYLTRERKKEALKKHVAKLWEEGDVVILDASLRP